jgi:hypothetical protein
VMLLGMGNALPSFSDSLNCAGPYDGRHYFPITIPVSLLLTSVGFPKYFMEQNRFHPS